MKRILILSYRVPYPLNEGGTIGIFRQLKIFKELGWVIDMVALSGKKHHSTAEESKAFLQPYLRHYYPVWVDTDVKPLGAIKALLQNQSYNVVRYDSAGIHQKVDQLLTENTYDIVQFDSIFMAPYLAQVRAKTQVPCILRNHNTEFQIWERLAQEESNPIKKGYLTLLAKQLKKYEFKMSPKFDALVSVIDTDAEMAKAYGPKLQRVCRVGIESESWDLPLPNDWSKAYHLGSLEWEPNKAGVRWLINEVWENPSLHPKAMLAVAGKGMPAAFKALSTARIDMAGEVPDAKAFVGEHSVCLVPIKSGSGLRIKILEAMAAGRLVISTTAGIQGIATQNKKEFLLADTAEDFIAQINFVIQHPEKAREIVQNARTFIQKEFDLKTQMSGLSEFYMEMKNSIEFES